MAFEYLKVLLVDKQCIEVVDPIINNGKLEALEAKCTPSSQLLRADECPKKSTLYKPTKSSFDYGSPHSLRNTLSL